MTGTRFRNRFTTIAHAGHRYFGPMSDASVDAMLARIAPPLPAAPPAPEAGPRLLDFLDAGCGRAELLLRALVRFPASGGTGLDVNAEFLARARAEAAARGLSERTRFVLGPADAFEVPAGSVHAAFCTGATHAFGDLRATLTALRKLVSPGGWILAGDGHWKQPPAREYLEFLGGTEDEFRDHAGTFATGAACGLEPVAASESSPAEWDAYEDLYAATVERFSEAHPDDPDREAMLARIRPWRAMYLKLGRATLGFGLYLYRRPVPFDRSAGG